MTDLRRYQVFVSSTFLDLIAERQAVTAALLECDAFPAGMELFPAADDDAWTLIKKVIDECDYYLLVIGGKYGSVDPDVDLSYTEKEFDYAVAQRKPVMAFVHGDPTSLPVIKAELESDKRERLSAFREKVTATKHVKYWTSAEGLAGQVALSYNKFVRLYEAVGWVRADAAASSQILAELSDARAEVARLTLAAVGTGAEAPRGSEDLAQGDDEFVMPMLTRVGYHDSEGSSEFVSMWLHVPITWNYILRAIGPKMYDECDEQTMRDAIEEMTTIYHYDAMKALAEVKLKKEVADLNESDPHVGIASHPVDDEDFGTILTQFKALGLIERSARKRSVSDTKTYWRLTTHGERETVRLCAIRRGDGSGSEGTH